MKNSMYSIWHFLYECKSDNECKERVQAMIDNGTDITADDNYAVRLAARYGHTETVRLLIDYGADITADDNRAVRWAASSGHMETVRLLIEHGADITA